MDEVIIDPFQFAAPGVFDADAADYITRVNAVDAANGASGGLEAGLQDIIHILFRDLKLDASPSAGVSNFAALKASCLLAGPRTRQGCAVPLLSSMPTPTFQGTAGGWVYNRKNGLQGNGTNNYLDSGRSYLAGSVNNVGLGIHITAGPSVDVTAFMGAAGRSETHIGRLNATGGSNFTVFSRCKSATRADTIVAGPLTGYFGMARTASSSYSLRGKGSDILISQPSQADNPTDGNYFIFARNNNGAADINMNGVASYYFFGESVTQSTLYQRITAYMNALNALTLT